MRVPAGIHVKGAAKGRVEGVKIHNCNAVQCVRGIVAENVLHVSCVQNHINVSEVGIDAVDCDQCFYMANLIYHHHGEGQGIRIAGTRPVGKPPAGSQCANGNIIVGVKVWPSLGPLSSLLSALCCLSCDWIAVSASASNGVCTQGSGVYMVATGYHYMCMGQDIFPA